jgi:hypothetical protein
LADFCAMDIDTSTTQSGGESTKRGKKEKSETNYFPNRFFFPLRSSSSLSFYSFSFFLF